MRMKTTGLDKMTERIRGMAERAKNTAPLTSEIAKRMEQFTKERLETRTSPDGTPFAPLAPATIKRKKYPPSKKGPKLKETVYASGQLDKAVFGASAPYSGFLQKGTANMPARPFLFAGNPGKGPAAEQAEEIKELIRSYIKGESE